MSRRRIEPKIVLVVFLVLELVVIGLLFYSVFLQVTMDEPPQNLVPWLATVAAVLGLVYFGYVEVRARKFSQHLIDEKLKTHSLLESMPTGVVILDSRQKILAINPKGAEVLGVGLEDVIERDFCSLVDEQTGNFLRSGSGGRIQALDPSGAKKYKLNITQLKNGGQLIMVDELREGAGTSPSVLQKVTRTLPMLMMRLWESIGKLDVPQDPDRRRAFASVIVLVRKALNLFEESTQPRVGAKVKTDLKDAAKRLTERYASLCQAKSLQVEVTINGDTTVRADREMLSRTMDEIFFNALAYTKEGGKVQLTIEGGATDVQVQVRDTGVGMAMEDISQAFEMGYSGRRQLPETEGGRGYGLYYAKQVIDQHGGTIFVESKPDVGTRVTFTVPR